MSSTLFDKQWTEASIKPAAGEDYEIVEHGWEQHVLIDHEKQIVYRYPRNESAAAKLADEIAVLDRLAIYPWPVRIPKMIAYETTHAVYRFIPGDVLSQYKFASLTDAQVRAIGEKLGEFFIVMHSVEHAVVQAKHTKQTMTLKEYYTKRIEGSPDNPFESRASEELRALAAYPPVDQVVVHGDLHGLNMVVDPSSNELVGVIDFSEIEIGDPNQDFRKIFMADPRLLEPAVAIYNQSGRRSVDIEKIKLWAYVNEWANVCYFAGTPGNQTYQRAYEHLKLWQRI